MIKNSLTVLFTSQLNETAALLGIYMNESTGLNTEVLSLNILYTELKQGRVILKEKTMLIKLMLFNLFSFLTTV